MHLRAILNRFHRQSGFVYGTEQWSEYEGQPAIIVPIRPRAGKKAICSGCGKPRPGYDTLDARLFQFVPFWGILVFFMYAMRRVDCPLCGVKVESVPWGKGKCLTTTTFDWFIAHWAKLLSWEEAARQFRISWSTVWRCVDKAVEWGRAHMNLDGISAIGVDEVSQKKGHNYLTLVYQIGGSYRRLLYVAEGRKEESFKGFFDWLGKERCSLIEVVCSDMWKAYLNVIKERLPKAIHILDRFHIMAHFGKAINEIRAAEAKASKRNGETLKKTKWLFLKRPENLTDGQGCRLRDLLRLNLRTVRAYLLREEFQLFWEYTSSGWARRFLKTWTTKAMRSRLEPMKRVAQMLRTHEEEILNWFKIKFDVALGATEGFNGKVRVFTKRAFGYRTVPAMKRALFHGLSGFPTPTFTHRFW